MHPEPLLTVSEISSITKIAPSTWYQWVSEGRVPHLKLGTCVRFRWSQIEQWLAQQSKPGRLSRVPAVEV